MELPNTLPGAIINSLPRRLDDVQSKSVACFYPCLIGLGDFLTGLMSFGVLVILPIIELVIGMVYFNECSMNSFIPVYLVVAGLNSSILLVFVILAVKFAFGRAEFRSFCSRGFSLGHCSVNSN